MSIHTSPVLFWKRIPKRFALCHQYMRRQSLLCVHCWHTLLMKHQSHLLFPRSTKTYQISAVILGEYCELVEEEKGSKKFKTSIEVLYDIVLAAFVEVIRKYQPLLKDIDLDEEVKDMIKFAMDWALLENVSE